MRPTGTSQDIVLPVNVDSEDQELAKLCVRETLKEYLNRTLFIRNHSKISQLFLYYGSKRRGQPVSKCRISEWLKLVIKDVYARHRLPSPKCQGHDTMGQL